MTLTKIEALTGTLFKTAVLAVLTGAMMSMAPASAAFAQDEEAAEEGEDRTFSTEIGEIVLEAQEALQAEQPNYQAAIQSLNNALAKEPSPYEEGVILQMRGQAYYGAGQSLRAAEDWRAIMDNPTITPEQRNDLMSNVGQIYIIEGRVDEGIAMLEQWLENNPPKETILLMMAQALAQDNQFQRALPYAEQMFELADPKERKHFDLLNYLYNQLEMPEKQADIIRQMLNRWPDDKNLWNAWVSMLAQGGRNEEAFEVNKLMYLNGMLEEPGDIMRLLQYYSFYEVPFRGAQILEREMNAGRVPRSQKNVEFLIDMWRQAREYDEAIPVLEEAAANASGGALYQELCEAYYSEAQYAEAEEACLNALEKGGLERPGDSWVLVGNSRYERDNVAGAREAFQRGAQFSHSRASAQGWLQFINEEQAAEQRRAELDEIVEREECIITIQRIRRDDVLEGREGMTSIPERCRKWESYVES